MKPNNYVIILYVITFIIFLINLIFVEVYNIINYNEYVCTDYCKGVYNKSDDSCSIKVLLETYKDYFPNN